MIGQLFQRRTNSKPSTPEQPLAGKTFVLCVGAQKAGTTWLYDYLATHPECHMPQTKELHVFDALFLPNYFRSFATNATRTLLTELELCETPKGTIAPTRKLTEARAIVRAQLDAERYPEIFAGLRPNARLTGDITPSYAALGADHFARIRQTLLDAGAAPKVVFLMRDPVERSYSAARMWARRAGAADLSDVHDRLLHSLTRKQHNARGRYDLTIAALDAAFPPEERFMGFYETLFTEAELARLCRFLDLPLAPADFDKRLNSTGRPGDLPVDVSSKLREAFDPVYRFCRDRFGEDLPPSWHA